MSDSGDKRFGVALFIAANVGLGRVFPDTRSSESEQRTGANVLPFCTVQRWLLIAAAFDFHFDLPHCKNKATSVAASGLTR